MRMAKLWNKTPWIRTGERLKDRGIFHSFEGVAGNCVSNVSLNWIALEERIQSFKEHDTIIILNWSNLL